MLRGLLCFFLAAFTVLSADSGVGFSVGGRNYQLQGGYAVVSTLKGKTQLLIAVRDTVSKAQLAITAELPAGALDGPLELSADLVPLSAVIVNAKGIYSLAPHISLARDDFMRYTKREEIVTGEMEDDPHDRPQDRIAECHGGFSETCRYLMRQKRHKRKKIKVSYTQHAPTWVGKSRDQRIASGDGTMREEKYRDTSFILRITPVKTDGKLTGLTGSFAGVVVYNEGIAAAVKLALQNGQFSVQVQNAP